MAFFHTVLEKDRLKRHKLINFPDATIAKTNSIPGLYIFNDFVSLEEEALVIKGLDHSDSENKWQKLLNRRV